ncbi:SpoIIE family protein phosphatase [Ferrimonas sp. SCSIO 43195]|uniref:SpoIIE family protein phosphatase n=1 Tax=Ferrimonas sp. SCSIO 43195 TaxID=2822844 RepID=UPI00207581A2|nr:SpoIIE family protein phosphatase [Ferrimonas sp. SCSIO 43195]USD35705.1 SpoIIE family protein phosphatase [Ferrimonas sp. SCSIO 43195]
MKALLLTLPVVGTRAGVRQARIELTKGLCRLGVVDSVAEPVLTAVSEYLNNLVQHSRHQVEAIQINLYRRPGSQYLLQIEDNGPPFVSLNRRLSDARRLPLTFAESAMGLGLISHCVPRAHYRWHHQANLFELPFSGRPVHATILVIDDDRSQLAVINAWLSPRYRVICCSSVAQAQSWLEQEPVDLLLSDLHMPGGDGLTLRHWLCAKPERAALPFLAMSSDAEGERMAELAACGIDEVLTKPLSAARLTQSIERALIRHRQLQQINQQQLEQQLTRPLSPCCPPDTARLSFSLRHQPKSLGGGDLLIDHYQQDGTRMLLLVDSQGHGVSAKLIAHTTSGLIHSILSQQPWRPGPLLARLSDALECCDHVPDAAATALACLVDADGGLILAAAGHPPPRLLGRGINQDLRVEGPLLGLAKNQQYQEFSYSLDDNSRLLFYTDGWQESFLTFPEIGFQEDPESMIEMLWHLGNDAFMDDATLLLVGLAKRELRDDQPHSTSVID